MDRGLYVAAAGMRAEQVRQDALAGDLANAATPGYKRDRTVQSSFGDLLLSNTRTGAVVGRVGLGPYAAETATDIRPAAPRETGEPLDFAIEGDGFFALRTPEGTRFARAGRFTAAADGTLTDPSGNAVLGRDGAPVRVGPDGTVDPGRLAVTLLQDPVKRGDALFEGTPGGPGATGPVRAGMLETSGVDPTRAMVDMIASLRAFEAGQKSITTIDETLGLAAGRVGSASGS